ncbi:MAG: hypothetical protein AB1555_09095 [Nitrospirota bacterium]
MRRPDRFGGDSRGSDRVVRAPLRIVRRYRGPGHPAKSLASDPAPADSGEDRNVRTEVVAADETRDGQLIGRATGSILSRVSGVRGSRRKPAPPFRLP